MTQKTNNKMAKGSPYLSIITLNVNALTFQSRDSFQIKGHKQGKSEKIKKDTVCKQ